MSELFEDPGYLEDDEAFHHLYSEMESTFPLPIRLDPDRFHDVHALHQLFLRSMPREEGLAFCEIGCAPGQWLVYFNQYFKYRVFGMDRSADGVRLAKANLGSLNIPGEVICADAFTMPFGEKRFDVVFSHSLIEHFQNPGPVFELHDKMTRPGGTIYIGMPNIRYLNRLIFRLGDFLFGKFKQLGRVHNFATADLSVFRNAAEKWGWEIAFLDYVGFFIPQLFTPPQSKKFAKRDIYKTGFLVGRKMPKSRFFAPTICLIARKK